MEVSFGDDALDLLETDPQARTAWDHKVVRAYRKVMNFIRQAADERDLYTWKSLNFEKLKGSRSHQHSLRLNDQWRLIVEIRKASPRNVIHVVGIEDYH